MKHALRQKIRQFMAARSGVFLGPEKDYLIDSRLHRVLAERALPSLSELVRRLELQADPGLESAVLSALTTHETSWFRDQRPYERLRREVLPGLRQRDGRQLRIWSAACSTGQEVYSIAMVLHEEGFVIPAWEVSLLASDLCEHSLAQARAGVYSRLEVERGLSPQHIARYFEAVGEAWAICPALRQGLRFESLNLIRLPDGMGEFDIIFCRNVLIYFEAATQRLVLQALHDRLRPGGVLFLGAAETPLGLCDALLPYSGTNGLYYRA